MPTITSPSPAPPPRDPVSSASIAEMSSGNSLPEGIAVDMLFAARPVHPGRPSGFGRGVPRLSLAFRGHAPTRPLVLRDAGAEEHPPRAASDGLLASDLPAAHRSVPYRAGAGRLCPPMRGSDLHAAAGRRDCERAKAVRAAWRLHPVRRHDRSAERPHSIARRLRAAPT